MRNIRIPQVFTLIPKFLLTRAFRLVLLNIEG